MTTTEQCQSVTEHIDQAVTLLRSAADYQLDDAKRLFMYRFIRAALKDAKGNKCRAAITLGVHRNTLTRTIDDLRAIGDLDEFVATLRRPSGRVPGVKSQIRRCG